MTDEEVEKLFDNAPVCEFDYQRGNNAIYWFGQSPTDPTKIITEESKFLLLSTNDDERTKNIVAKKRRMNGETMLFLFERTEGERKIQYWSKATTNEELKAAKNFFSFDENLMRVVETSNQETQMSSQHSQNCLVLSQQLKLTF